MIDYLDHRIIEQLAAMNSHTTVQSDLRQLCRVAHSTLEGYAHSVRDGRDAVQFQRRLSDDRQRALRTDQQSGQVVTRRRLAGSRPSMNDGAIRKNCMECG